MADQYNGEVYRKLTRVNPNAAPQFITDTEAQRFKAEQQKSLTEIKDFIASGGQGVDMRVTDFYSRMDIKEIDFETEYFEHTTKKGVNTIITEYATEPQEITAPATTVTVQSGGESKTISLGAETPASQSETPTVPQVGQPEVATQSNPAVINTAISAAANDTTSAPAPAPEPALTRADLARVPQTDPAPEVATAQEAKTTVAAKPKSGTAAAAAAAAKAATK